MNISYIDDDDDDDNIDDYGGDNDNIIQYTAPSLKVQHVNRLLGAT